MRLLLYVYAFWAITISTSAAKTKDGILLPCSQKNVSISSRPILTSEEKSLEKYYNKNALELKKKLINAKKSFLPSSSLKKNMQNIFKSVFVIKNKSSSGSGFYTSLWGIPVGITNAHVIATMKEPIIMDGKGNSYNIKSMLVLPERDIVIFELNNPGNLKPIPMAHNVVSIPVRSGIYAYGNSQGEGVITKLHGTILGVGPKKIEITAGIAPGNSGGPVIYKNKIIGVSTYVTRSSASNWTLQGTRFERKANLFGVYYGGIRRFAVRIDSIVPEKTKILNPISSARDIEIIQELKEANNAALDYQFKRTKDYLQGKRYTVKLLKMLLWLTYSDKKLRKTIEHCYSNLRVEPNRFTCSNKTLEKQLLEQISVYRRNSCLWEFEELFSSKDPIFLKNFSAVIKNLKRYYQRPQKCPFCKGKGFFLVEKDVNNVNDNKLRSNFRTIRHECQACLGKGITKLDKYYVLKNQRYTDNIYKPLSISFLGFQPGSELKNSRKERLKMKFVAKKYSGINSTYIYTKTPRFPLANALILNFVLGKLQEIRIHFPYSKALYQQMKNRLEDKYGKFTWETDDKSSFCQINKPDFTITIGVKYILSQERNPEISLYVNCKHKKLSNAKFTFNKLKDTTSNIKNFKVHRADDTGF